jgi:hypothetical protein
MKIIPIFYVTFNPPVLLYLARYRAPSHVVNLVLGERQLRKSIERVDGRILRKIRSYTLRGGREDSTCLITIIGQSKLIYDDTGVTSHDESNDRGFQKRVVGVYVMGFSTRHQKGALEEYGSTTGVSFFVDHQAFGVLGEGLRNSPCLLNNGGLYGKVVWAFKLRHQIITLILCFQWWSFVYNDPRARFNLVARFTTETASLCFDVALRKILIV